MIIVMKIAVLLFALVLAAFGGVLAKSYDDPRCVPVFVLSLCLGLLAVAA